MRIETVTPLGEFIKELKISRRKFTKIINDNGISVCVTSVNGYCNGTKNPTLEQAYLILKVVHGLGGTHLDILDIILPIGKRKELEQKAKSMIKSRISEDGDSDFDRQAVGACRD